MTVEGRSQSATLAKGITSRPVSVLSILRGRGNSINVANGDAIIIKDCKETVKTLNREVAGYRHYLLYTNHQKRDTAEMRERLHEKRSKMVNLCVEMKSKMVPYLRGRETNVEIFAIFVNFTSCADLLLKDLLRSYRLFKIFPVTTLSKDCTKSRTSMNSINMDNIETRNQSIISQHNELVSFRSSEIDACRSINSRLEGPGGDDDLELTAIHKDIDEIIEIFSDVDDLILRPTEFDDEEEEGNMFDLVNLPLYRRRNSETEMSSDAVCCLCGPMYM